MQDSSTNPYIPQESEAIRQKVYQRQSPLGRLVKWSLIITAIVAVLVGGSLIYIIPKTTADDQPARIKLADIMQAPADILKRVDVTSNLGFELNYDFNVYSSYAEVGDSTAGSDESAAVANGQTYENDELRVKRDYNYVRIRPVESIDSARALAPLPPELEIFATVKNEDLTKALTVPENKGMSMLGLFVKQDTDKRLAKRKADDKTVVTIEATKPVSQKINGVDYQKVRFTTTNENYRVSNVKYDDCYYTIQNKQPYSLCITDVRPYNVSAASLVENVFNSVTYQQIDSNDSSDQKATGTEARNKTSFAYPLARLAQATTPKSTDTTKDDTSNTPDSEDDTKSALKTIKPAYYDDAGSLKAIVKNQPSVVRIGMLYCADIALKFESGETATNLTDACVGSLSSGVFVSKDGYIATTGHAIRAYKKAAINGYINFAPDQNAKLDRLQRILDYLLDAKILLQSDADYLKTGASIGDQDALAKIENIASVIPDKFINPVKEEYSYAVQPGEKPIVINRTDTNKPTFAYSDSVIKATYVASNYEPEKSVQEVFGSVTPKADVGLIKVEMDAPEVTIVSNEDVKANDTLSTIGYPAYTDSSLTVDRIRNIPVVTMNNVEQAYEKEGTRLIQTDMPVLPGNDGAPVFNNEGLLVGFAVYGLSYCPDQLCFSNGTVRSASELLTLLDDQNKNLAKGSLAMASWTSGVDEYFKANYASSSNAFGQAGSLYSFNRWADDAQKLAVSYQGTELDTSLMNQLQLIMIIVLIILVVLTIILAIAFVIHRRRINDLRVGHYGAADSTVMQPSTALPPSYPSSNGVMGQNLPPANVSQQPTPPQSPQPQQPVPPSNPSQPEDPFYRQ